MALWFSFAVFVSLLCLAMAALRLSVVTPAAYPGSELFMYAQLFFWATCSIRVWVLVVKKFSEPTQIILKMVRMQNVRFAFLWTEAKFFLFSDARMLPP